MKQDLAEELRSWLGPEAAVVVGVGNRQRSDDAAGVEVAERLQAKGVKVVVAEDVPESYTDVIKAAGVRKALFVDAVELGASPGDVALLGPDSLLDDRFDTHRPSLSLVMRYLEQEAGIECRLLGIQPRRTHLGFSLSEEVRATVESIEELLGELLRERPRAR